MHELRDKNIQSDRLRFTRNLERIGELLAYEISKGLGYKHVHTETQFGSLEVPSLDDEIVLATIFRAGLPVHKGFLNIFDMADSALIGAARKMDENGSSHTEISYDGSASIEGKVLIIIDAMMATGVTIVDVYKKLLTHGQPKKTILAGIIASSQAVSYLQLNLPDQELHICAVDSELNPDLYIVPGLGDAGDLIYGTKIS